MDSDNCAVRIAVRERPFNVFELRSGNSESAVEVHPSNHNVCLTGKEDIGGYLLISWGFSLDNYCG